MLLVDVRLHAHTLLTQALLYRSKWGRDGGRVAIKMVKRVDSTYTFVYSGDAIVCHAKIHQPAIKVLEPLLYTGTLQD